MKVLDTIVAGALTLHVLGSLAAGADATPPAAVGAAPAAATPQSAASANVAPSDTFVESTKVDGKIDANLTGVWLLAAWFPIGKEDNYRTIPQLLKITSEKDGLQFHVLDLDLPEGVQQELKKANQGPPPHTKWVPSAEALKALAAQWKQLPRRPIKGPGDSVYGSIEFMVVAPDQYQSSFGALDPQLDKVLAGSKFAIRINEKYKPQPMPENSRMAQLITRRSVYGVKSVEKELLTGDQASGFVSASGSSPLPINLPGSFGLYRITPEV